MCLYLYRQYRKRQQIKASTSPHEPSEKQKKAKACPHRTASEAAQSPSKCTTCVLEKRAASRYRWKLLLLLLPGFFLASLDLTIVATALPFIASHFDKFNQLNWIVTAFTLTSTAFIPVFGQLSDTFGRHSALQLSIITLTIGSILCAAAPVWPVLLLGRGLQGVGSAGMSNVAMIVLADSVSLKEQAINTSIFQLLNGIGYTVGPVIGGYIVDSNWRYTFVVCAGMGAVSSLSILFLRKDLKGGSMSLSHPKNNQTRLQAFATGFATLDVGGILLFLFGTGLIILGTAWGGSTFPWHSGAVIASLIIGVALLITFIFYERALSPDRPLSRRFPRTIPLLPFDILRHKDVGLVCFIAAATGAALYSVFYFIGIYFTLVEAYPASRAGVQLLYYVPGLGVGVYAAIFFCNVTPRQTFWPLFAGTVVETAGIAALTYAVSVRNSTLVNVMMAIGGAGTGARFMPSNLHLAGMFRDRLAPVYSLLRFAMPFGGTLALTVMGSVFQNDMAQYFGSADVRGSLGNGTFNLHNQAALGAIAQLPPEQQEAIRSKGADATMWAFVSILPFLGCSLLASLALGNVWIDKGRKNKEEEGEAEAAAAGDGFVEEGKETGAVGAGATVLDGVYLIALVTGRVKGKRRVVKMESGVGGESSEGRDDVKLEPQPEPEVEWKRESGRQA